MVDMTTIVFAVLAACLCLCIAWVSVSRYREHRHPRPDPEALGGPELSVLERFDGVGHPVAPQVARSVDQDDLRTLGATILRARIAGDGETLQVLINTARPMDLLDGLMISAESLAFVVAKQRECSALEVAESLHYAAVDMFLGKGNPDDND